MQVAPIPPDERLRLAALRATEMLDSPADVAFNDLARLAARLCAAPIALVSLVDESRQWFKARVGLDAQETSRDIALCAHAILGSDLMIVPDARKDPRFADNPLVLGPPNLVFYAGMPLLSPEGHGLGTLCVIDHVPRTLTEDQQDALRVLGRQVAVQLDLRRQASELAVQAEELEAFFGGAVGLVAVVEDGHFTRVSPGWERALGYSSEELCARPVATFIHEDDLALQASLAREVEAGVNIPSLAIRFRTKQGGFRWIRGAAMGGGRLKHFGIGHDVTDEMELRAALEANQAKLAGVLAAAVDGILTIDERGFLLSANPAVEKLFGYTEEELLGTNVSRLMPEPFQSEHDGYLERYLRTGEERVIGKGLDLIASRKDGSTFAIYLTVGRLANSDRREFVGIVRDVTQRKAASDLLAAQSRKLARASEAAGAASRLKSEFLANMSHELRTPLNGILGFSKLLHDAEVGPVTAQQREFLGYVLTSGEHLLQLINDILDLSKVEAGKLEFHPVQIDLSKIVAESCGIVRELAAKKRLQIEVDLAQAPCAVFLDPARLKQILYNYLSNAIKFTHEEGSIIVRARPEAGERIRIEVQDTGIGISARDQKKLFSEFVQLDQSANKLHEGTGLGLALTKRIVEAQGGEVGVVSEKGVGSTFYAILPRTFGPSEREMPTESEFPPNNVQAHEEPSRPRVLVVEDDARDRAWLRRTLGQAGYTVFTCATGEEGVQRACTERYDAVTLDLFLPDMTGLDVLAAIRAGEMNQSIPAILVTVVADEGVVAGYAIHEFLTKPVKPEALLAALERAGVGPASLPILIVDDDPAALELAASALRSSGLEIKTAENGERGLAIAREGPVAAVVLDLLTPVLDGFGFLEGFRRLPGTARTPVVVWSSKEITQAERARLQATVQAIVRKGAGASDALVAAVERQLGRASTGARE